MSKPPIEKVGMLSTVLLPLRARTYKRIGPTVHITLPAKYESDGVVTPLYEDGKLRLGNLTRVLYLMDQYPDLKTNEFFVGSHFFYLILNLGCLFFGKINLLKKW